MIMNVSRNELSVVNTVKLSFVYTRNYSSRLALALCERNNMIRIPIPTYTSRLILTHTLPNTIHNVYTQKYDSIQWPRNSFCLSVFQWQHIAYNRSFIIRIWLSECMRRCFTSNYCTRERLIHISQRTISEVEVKIVKFFTYNIFLSCDKKIRRWNCHGN